MFMSWWQQRFLNTQSRKPARSFGEVPGRHLLHLDPRESIMGNFLGRHQQTHPTIKFTYKISEDEAVHFDTRVYVEGHRL